MCVAKEGFQRPHWPLRTDQFQGENAEHGKYGLSSMPSAWQDVSGGVLEADDGYRTNLPGATAQEGEMPGVHSRGRGRVAADTPLEPARRGLGGPGRGTPPPGGEAQTYQVSFLKHPLQLRCLVEGYLRGASNWTNLRIHFSH